MLCFREPKGSKRRVDGHAASKCRGPHLTSPTQPNLVIPAIRLDNHHITTVLCIEDSRLRSSGLLLVAYHACGLAVAEATSHTRLNPQQHKYRPHDDYVPRRVGKHPCQGVVGTCTWSTVWIQLPSIPTSPSRPLASARMTFKVGGYNQSWISDLD